MSCLKQRPGTSHFWLGGTLQALIHPSTSSSEALLLLPTSYVLPQFLRTILFRVRRNWRSFSSLGQAPPCLVNCISAFISISGWEVMLLPPSCHPNCLCLSPSGPAYLPVHSCHLCLQGVEVFSVNHTLYLEGILLPIATLLMPNTSLENQCFGNEWIPRFVHFCTQLNSCCYLLVGLSELVNPLECWPPGVLSEKHALWTPAWPPWPCRAPAYP